jgi:FkbH-like protein
MPAMAEADGTTPDLRAALARDLKPADYARLARDVRTADAIPGTTPLRLAILASWSCQFLEPFLVVEGLRLGFRVELHFGAFGQFEQELSDPAGAFWDFAPDVVVLAMRPEDVEPDAVVRYHASGGQRFRTLAETMLDRLTGCADAVRSRGTASVLAANFAPPASPPLGVFDANVTGSLTHALADANQRLAERVGGLPGAAVWDYAGLVRSRGAAGWTDPRLWALARSAVATKHQPALAAHLVRAIAALRRPPAKCLVLDLDNTIWGGVIGDDGPAGIQLGDDYPGSVFKSFQRAALGLMDRGILLAVVSKNDHEVAEQVFRTHPEMVIRWEDLSAVRINWGPKSENLRAIARELNIGADALVLFDDNPVERAEVRAGAPEVGVIDVPTDPLRYIEALEACSWFDQTGLSAEDRSRAEMYREDRARRSLEAAVADPQDFLRSLEMEAEVGRADATTLGRIAQLIGKTNQFNLTTRRHTQGEIAAMAGAADSAVAWLRLRDRFGDQGLVAVGIVHRRGTVGEVDTFLMSCRVMNRGVEQAFMAYLLEQARSMSCTSVAGEYLPTKKNGMVRELYPALGFDVAAQLPEGGARYVLDLGRSSVAWPDVIRRR